MFYKVIRICFVSRLITVIIAAHALVIKGGGDDLKKSVCVCVTEFE